MKLSSRIVSISLITCMTLCVAQSAFCGDPLKKLGRGCANALTCPLELGNQIGKASELDGVFAGWTVGVIKGLVMIPLRLIVGAYEIATFIIPIPAAYGPILKDPEFFLDNVLY